MAVGAALTQAGFTPGDLNTEAILELDMLPLALPAFTWNLSGAPIAGVSEEKFKEIAEGAKANCIVSKALSVPITLNVQYS